MYATIRANVFSKAILTAGSKIQTLILERQNGGVYRGRIGETGMDMIDEIALAVSQTDFGHLLKDTNRVPELVLKGGRAGKDWKAKIEQRPSFVVL